MADEPALDVIAKRLNQLEETVTTLKEGEKQEKLPECLKEKREKDKWDKFSSISAFLSTVVIAGFGTIATLWYTHNQHERDVKIKQEEDQHVIDLKREEVRISQAQAVKELIPWLAGRSEEGKKDEKEEGRRTAILVLSSLNDTDLVIRIAPRFPTSGGVEALEDLDKRKPQDDEIRKALASALAKRGDIERNFEFSEALKDYTKAMNYNPNESSAFLGRARTFDKLERYDEALADAKRYLEITDDKEDGYNWLAWIYYRRGVKSHLEADYDLAIENYTKAIDESKDLTFNSSSDTSYDFYSRGRTFEHRAKKGDLDRAIADYSEAIRLKPQDPEPYKNRAKLYLSKKMWAEAKEDSKKAQEIELEKKKAAAANKR